MSESDAYTVPRLYAMADLITPMAIRVAATLRIADRIDAGTRTAAGLAEETGTDPAALQRVLEHLVTVGVLAGAADGYALTELDRRVGGVGGPTDGARQRVLDGCRVVVASFAAAKILIAFGILGLDSDVLFGGVYVDLGLVQPFFAVRFFDCVDLDCRPVPHLDFNSAVDVGEIDAAGSR